MAPFIEDVEFDTAMTAYEYFAMIQFSQTVREMRARMVKSILDCEDVRDHMENLYCLYMDFVEVGAFKGARVSSARASLSALFSATRVGAMSLTEVDSDLQRM